MAYARIIHDTYDEARTSAKCMRGETEVLTVKVDVRRGGRHRVRIGNGLAYSRVYNKTKYLGGNDV